MAKLGNENLILRYTQTRDPRIKDEAVALYRPLVEHVARRLAFNRDDLDDLIQVGSMGLLRSLDRFDPTMQVDFATFATPNIVGEIKHYFRDKRNLVKIPRRLNEIYSKIKTFLKEAQHAGKNPTIAEIAQALETDSETILEAMEAGHQQSVLSLDMPGHNGDSRGGSDSIGDMLGDNHHEDIHLDKEALKVALAKLDPRERDLVDLRFYKGLSQREIADIVGVSQMHVSRLLAAIVKKLRKIIDIQ